MFFTRSDQESCSNLLAILDRYERASGQCINPAKSTVTFSSKTPLTTKNRVKLAMAMEKEGGIGKYLGLPENFGRRKRDIFNSIIDCIRQKVLSCLQDSYLVRVNKYYSSRSSPLFPPMLCHVSNSQPLYASKSNLY